MNIQSTIVVLASLAIASCTHVPRHDHDRGGHGMRGDDVGISRDANEPEVEVKNDVIAIVDQEPIFIPATYTNKHITWKLKGSSGYYFDRVDGIVVSPEKDSGVVSFTCAPVGSSDKPRHFRCDNAGRPGWYKYKIHVKGPADIRVDPWIRNS
jgi:hypothetical protein